jgi:hypothetical protein
MVAGFLELAAWVGIAAKEDDNEAASGAGIEGVDSCILADRPDAERAAGHALGCAGQENRAAGLATLVAVVVPHPSL